jgi:hypothetical protein
LSHDHSKPTRYNKGMLHKEKRAVGTVWVFRWSEEINGQRRQHKEVIGTAKQFPTEALANREADRFRFRLNEHKQSLNFKSIRFGQLINHYLDHELPRLAKSARNGNKSYIKNWIEPAWHDHVAARMKTMQIQEWLDKIVRPDGTKLKIKNVLSAIFSHGVRWELVERNPVCGQGGSPGQRGASTGVRQSNRVSITRVVLPPDVVRQTLEQLPLREATMALVDAVTALRASELIALKWKNVGLGDRNSSIRIRFSGRRIEENQKRQQSFTSFGAGSGCPPSVAEANSLPLGGRLDLCQSALSRQNSLHLPNLVPSSHSSCNRTSLGTQEQQTRTDRLAHVAPITCYLADLERGECEGHANTAASHNPEDNPRTLCASRFCRSTEGAQEGRQNGAPAEISREIEGEKRYHNRVSLRLSGVLGAQGCPVATVATDPKCFGIMVSAAGFEPATHALKGHCSTN